MGLNRDPCRMAVPKADRCDKAAEAEIAQGLLCGGRHRAHGRPPRTEPAADEARDQRAAAAAQRQRDTADPEADETSEQAGGNTGRDKGDVGAVTGAQDLSDLRSGALDIAAACLPAS